MSTTPNLALTYLVEGSAQKEVTINTNSDILDSAFAGFSTGHSKNLTNALTSLFEVALPANTRAGGVILSSILVINAGNDQQVLTEFVHWSVLNKGGVYTTDIKAVPNADSLVVAPATTLSNVWAILAGTDKVTIQLTPATSLTATGYAIRYTVINHSSQAITFL